MSNAVLTNLTETPAGPALAKAPTGISGLDQITGGGLPRGRTTLVAGGAGTGKTLLGVQFLVTGAERYGEPGVLVSFEETEAKVAANVRSLGFDLAEMQRQGLLAVVSFRVDAAEIIATGEFDFTPLFVTLADAIGRIGAKRAVLDTIDVLFGAFGSDSVVRSELGRLARWLEERGVSAIMTGERGETALTRHGIEEYVTDCVIVLDHRVRDEISTRLLRVVKYRGSGHGTNEYPFMISARGLSVLPVTSLRLDYEAPEERVSTGVSRLDRMLGGGLYRGSTTLVSGAAGTGKTSLAAAMVNAACQRGEQVLLALYEESPAQLLRNMRSIGIGLRRWLDAGVLRIWAARPSAFGLESHLAILNSLVEEVKPAVAVLDGIAALHYGATSADVTSVMNRTIGLLKGGGITTMATTLGHGGEETTIGVSSIVDTWLLLRNVESNGERNRLLFILKSRGSFHSNQVREFLLTSRGIELADVYVGRQGMLTGSARLAQQAAERDAEEARTGELHRRRAELRRRIRDHEASLAEVQDELAAEQTELAEIDRDERQRAGRAEADRAAMARQRSADEASRKEVRQ